MGVADIGDAVNTLSFDEQHRRTFGVGARQSLVCSHRQAGSSEVSFDLKAEMLVKCSRWKPLSLGKPNLRRKMVCSFQEDSPLDLSSCFWCRESSKMQERPLPIRWYSGKRNVPGLQRTKHQVPGRLWGSHSKGRRQASSPPVTGLE